MLHLGSEVGAAGLPIRAGPVLASSIQTKKRSSGQQTLTLRAGTA